MMEPDAELQTMLARYSGPEPGHPWEQTRSDIHRLAQRLQSVLQGFKEAVDDAGEIEVELAQEVDEVDLKARALLNTLWTSGWYSQQAPDRKATFNALAESSGWTAPSGKGQ